MTTINNAYINALLADATYVNNLTSASDLSDRLSKRMTPTIAKYIADNFSVVTQIETSDLFGSGFDATVWRHKEGGKLYVSMRGTEPLGTDLIDADFDLALNDSAWDALRDMVNWWLRETAGEGTPVRQVAVVRIPSGSLAIPDARAFAPAADALGTGRISAADMPCPHKPYHSKVRSPGLQD